MADQKNKRLTIKDIAKEAGVSVATVHCALYNKPGVSDAVREKIQKIAHDNEYKVNLNASFLKRRNLRIAVVFPEPVNEKRYYYQGIWDGIHDYVNHQNDFGIDLIEVAYMPENEDSFQALARTVNISELDAVLLSPVADYGMKGSASAFAGQNVPLVLVGSDTENVDRLFCIQPNFCTLGKMIMEQLISQMKSGKKIMLCAGNKETASHYLIVKGCFDYIKENNFDVEISTVYANEHQNIKYDEVLNILKSDNEIGACCSVNARGSVQLARALEETGLAGTIPAIGSDMFSENIDALKRGTFTNLINKNQYNQVLYALKYVVEFLAKDTMPPTDVMFSRCDLIFKSTVEMYENGAYRQLL